MSGCRLLLGGLLGGMHVVLQLTGVDKEWAHREEIGTCVSNVLKALEDVLCHGMGDLNDLIAIHSHGELLYQTLPSA
jgi:hypothetical protein